MTERSDSCSKQRCPWWLAFDRWRSLTMTCCESCSGHLLTERRGRMDTLAHTKNMRCITTIIILMYGHTRARDGLTTAAAAR